MTIVLDYLLRFPFYRCEGCSRLTTELEMSSKGNSYACPCGSASWKPTNLLWYENLYLRSLRMLYALLITKEIEIGPLSHSD